VDQPEIGRQLRARRTAAGRTVASVAADAGLSVPYIANLENGRGNPTTAALTRLAEALGLRLVVGLAPAEEGSAAVSAPGIPASLVRLGRTDRFRSAVAVMAPALDVSPDEFSVQLVAALAALAQAMGRDLAEADWWRLLDALLLVAAHPAGRAP
jgi:transcriptional regulator with XRE-family HTH domain